MARGFLSLLRIPKLLIIRPIRPEYIPSEALKLQGACFKSFQESINSLANEIKIS